MNRLHLKFVMTPLAASAAMLVSTANATDPIVAVANIRQIMQQGINASTMEVWDVGNNAMNEEGGIDPEQMTPESWARLETAAEGLKASALEMYNAEAFLAASPEDMPEQDAPGVVSMEDVQRFIDADHDAFRAAAKGLADHSDLLIAAARNRDASAAGDLVAQLDQVCEVCHAQFWYPEQNVLARR
ncbi:MAG TPA: hypothetical protein VLA37_11485 [Sphingomonadaceae bacterium]|nr:hypothetical protein [Sphingomonadaceae bacterium]